MTTTKSLPALPDVESNAPSSADAVDDVLPAVVLRPSTMAAVAAAMRACAERGLCVVARGGGTALSLGNAPASVDVLLDLSALNRVIEYRPADRTITVEAGARVADVQRLLDGERQLLALDPPLPEQATVGGTLAAGRAGPRRYRYGTARDLTIGLTAILGDGTSFASGGRVVKNVAGYDLIKLAIGSAGTLAVITSATFKLWPAPPERALTIIAYPSLESAHAGAMAVAGSTLDPLTLDLAGPAVLSDDDGCWRLVCELGGPSAALDRIRGELAGIAGRTGASEVANVAASDRDRAPAALRDFGVGAREHGATIVRAAVLPSRVAAACRALERATVTRPRFVVRAGNGVVLAAWRDDDPAALPGIIAAMRRALAPLGGTLTVEQCPAPAKATIEAWGIAGPDVVLMQQIKQALDPGGTLAPRRGPGRM